MSTTGLFKWGKNILALNIIDIHITIFKEAYRCTKDRVGGYSAKLGKFIPPTDLENNAISTPEDCFFFKSQDP